MRRGVLLGIGALALLTAAVVLTLRSCSARLPAREGHTPGGKAAGAVQPIGAPGPAPAGGAAGRGLPEEEPGPDAPLAPLRVGFLPGGKGRPGEAVPVDIVVERNRQGWPAGAGGEGEMELLIRLPMGVRLEESEGWESADLQEEKEDPSGPWSSFGKRRPIRLSDGPAGERLASEPLRLAVVEEGVNWVITCRVRLVLGPETWQAFGVIFATLQGQSAEFHPTPKTPSDLERAAHPGGGSA